MNKKIYFLNLLFLLLLGSTQSKAQDIQMIKGQQITEWKNNTSDTIYVINFWATWCKPCLMEMPAFDHIGKEFEGKKVRVILVSNDFKKQIDTKLKPYIRDRKIKNQVVFMDETNPNKWIDLVDPDWGGSIPATLILKGSMQFIRFHEGVLTYEELKTTIDSLNP